MDTLTVRTSYYQKVEQNLQHNKSQFSAFLDYLENSGLSPKSIKTYLSRITGFLLYLNEVGVNIEDLSSTEHIVRYAETKDKELDFAFKASLKLFLLLANQTVKVQISEQEIEKMDFKRESVRSATPLDIQEIIEIRNKLRVENSYHFLFVFEMFLTHGIELDQFQHLEREQFSLKENVFRHPSGDTKVLGKMLTELLTFHEDLPEPRVPGTLQGYIKQIGTLVKRDKLIWQDIIATRKEYFPTCPDCGDKYPNTEDFWVLLEHQFDESKTRWLLCRKCARNRIEGSYHG
jgi:hypothetical protein